MLLQKASSAGLAAVAAIALASAPAAADPIVLSPNLVANGASADAQRNNGNLFLMQNWTPDATWQRGTAWVLQDENRCLSDRPPPSPAKHIGPNW